jgi:hypothetical protein
MRSHRGSLARVAALAILVAIAVGAAPSRAQQSYQNEIYQDFRGKKPLVDDLKLVGPDVAETITPEDGGLRITLPKTRKARSPTGVRLAFPLSGDFEITATYEMLSIDRPPPDSGVVGISFNLIAQAGDKKFARLGRFQHPQIGNAYLRETQKQAIPTEATSGQMRLVRQGSKLRYLVADDPPNQFHEFHEKEYTDGDLETVRIGANNNGSPAGIDVRLVDLRIRYGAAAPGPVVVPLGPDVDPPQRGLLTLLLALGLGLVLLLALAAGAWLHMRRRAAAEASEQPASHEERS